MISKIKLTSAVFSFSLLAALAAGVLAQTEDGARAVPSPVSQTGGENSAVTPPRPTIMREKRETLKEKREAIGDKRREVREEVKIKREERKENAAARREEAQKRIAEKRRSNIRRRFAEMLKRFEAALEREKKLVERIQSRIDKARVNGGDVTKAQALLDQVKRTWQEAKTALDDAKGRVEGVISSADPKAAMKEVEKIIKTARDKIKKVHAGLVEVISALKGIGEGVRKPASSPAATPAPSPVSSPTPSSEPSQ